MQGRQLWLVQEAKAGWGRRPRASGKGTVSAGGLLYLGKRRKLPLIGYPTPTTGPRTLDGDCYFWFSSTCSLLDMAIIWHGRVSVSPTHSKQVCIRLFLTEGWGVGRPAYSPGHVLWDAGAFSRM